ncbi:hypothetical protein K439DRAFT_327089 [Ramaria rubella]|nr:hypothetical protein K439DRAFT_327089 [Ramaria rubella]
MIRARWVHERHTRPRDQNWRFITRRPRGGVYAPGCMAISLRTGKVGPKATEDLDAEGSVLADGQVTPGSDWFRTCYQLRSLTVTEFSTSRRHSVLHNKSFLTRTIVGTEVLQISTCMEVHSHCIGRHIAPHHSDKVTQNC